MITLYHPKQRSTLLIVIVLVSCSEIVFVSIQFQKFKEYSRYFHSNYQTSNKSQTYYDEIKLLLYILLRWEKRKCFITISCIHLCKYVCLSSFIFIYLNNIKSSVLNSVLKSLVCCFIIWIDDTFWWSEFSSAPRTYRNKNNQRRCKPGKFHQNFFFFVSRWIRFRLFWRSKNYST